jgi:uncharacterized tellurite resistance protein B-like protein
LSERAIRCTVHNSTVPTQEALMKSFFSHLFGLDEAPSAPSSSDTETVRKIIREVDRLDPVEGRYIAAFAFVLSRVANADLEISDEETLRMEEVVRDIGGIEEALAVLVVQIAKSQQSLIGGAENYLVTRQFNTIATPEQKERLLHCLFEIAAADDKISLVEENEIRKIAEELRFDHSQFSEIRSKFNKHRTILR